MSGAVADTPAGARRLWPLWLLILIFALPALAAWFFHFNPERLPATRVNRGELIEPVRPWQGGLGLAGPDGSVVDAATFRGRWTLLVASRAPCGVVCERRLAELRQIRLALGEGRYLVERVAVLVGDGDTALATPLAGTHVLRASGEAEPGLRALLGPAPDVWDRIYVVDPFGNLMMRYAADAPAKDVLKDLERLLKGSRNWIKGAGYGHR